jgi:DNA-binding MarR family transcriptional regulator
VSISDAPASPPLDLGGLQDLLGFQLRMAHVAMHRDFVTAMTDLGLTQKQFASLRLIMANPGASQADLATILGTDRATMMALVDRLDQREFVERRRSTTDRRRQELHLTSAGKSFLVKAERVLDEHEKRFTSMFSDKELRAFIAALARMHGDRALTP